MFARSRSSASLKDRVQLVPEQLKNRSTAGTLLVRERPSRPRSQPFQKCGSRKFHRVVWFAAHGERNGFERMKVLVTGSSGLIGSQGVEHFEPEAHEDVAEDNNMSPVFLGSRRDPLSTHGSLQRLH